MSRNVQERGVIRTLVVDDSPIILKLLSSLLAGAGDFELVGTAMDGRRAVRSAAELGPDLVLMDLRMPGMGGLEATRRIKQSAPGLVVIVVSADDTPESRGAARAVGADAFVSKRDVSGRLLATIRDQFRFRVAR